MTAIAGITCAAILDRAGHRLAGLLTCALTGLLISPISWDHHWVWAVPALVVLTDAAMRSEGARRRGCWLLAAGLFVVYGDWPSRLTGAYALLPQGLLGFFIGPHPDHEKYHLHGLQVVSWNLYVLGGLGLLALAVAAAFGRARTAPPAVSETSETSGTNGTHATREAPVGALSARAGGQ